MKTIDSRHDEMVATEKQAMCRDELMRKLKVPTNWEGTMHHYISIDRKTAESCGLDRGDYLGAAVVEINEFVSKDIT